MQTEKPRSKFVAALSRTWQTLSTPLKRFGTILRDKSRSKLNRFGYLVAGGAGASLSGFAVLWLYLLLLIPFTPGSRSLERAKHQSPSQILSADGAVLARLESLHRDWMPLEKISPHVVNALIATEDHRFYKHDGVDNRRLLASVFHTLTGDAQGGSTLTMQLARNLYPERIGNNRSINRKLKEIVTAKKIEHLYSKDEIVETYLNTVPFLYNARGIEMAAHTYFGKNAAELSVLESATLVGMLKGTSYYNPIRNPERAKTRRNVVLALMVRNGKLDAETFEELKDKPVNARLRRQQRPARTASHFVNQVEMQARRWADENGYDLEADGLIIKTTLNSKLQHNAEQALRRQTNALQNVANVEWSTASTEVYSSDIRMYASKARSVRPFEYFWREKTATVDAFIRDTPRYRRNVAGGATDTEAIDNFRSNRAAMDSLRESKTRLEAGFVAIEPNSGHILAWVGSRDYTSAPFDHVASARRQPGSTFKPIVYASALRKGYRPDDFFDDTDVNIRIGKNDIWKLAGSSYTEDEVVSLRNALAHSRNNITAALMADVGIRRTAQLGRHMGISESPLVEVPSLALGTSPVTLLEMSTVYNTIASGGVRHDPILITSIVDADGNVLEEFSSREKRVLAEELSLQLTDMMRTVVDEGTGRRIRHQFGIDADVAGKTGTTQNNMDGWFFLMHPSVVAGAWVGFDDPRVTFRSDFWGEGAHNALFLVGDFYREGIRRGQISRSALFDDPNYVDRTRRFADVEADRDGQNGSGGANDAAESGAPFGQSDPQVINWDRFLASVESIQSSLAQRFAGVAEDWTPEYEFSGVPFDRWGSGNVRQDQRWADNQNDSGNDAEAYPEPERRIADTNRRSSRNGGYDDNQQRNRSYRDNSSRLDWDRLEDVLNDERFAILEEKRQEYQELTRDLERRLEELRREPETRELERVIREAYLTERARNPSLRRLEERLGIDLD